MVSKKAIISLSLMLIIIFIPSKSMAKTVLACVGNSITERGGSSGYVALIAKRLGSDYDVKNYGLSGRTMCKNGNAPYWKEKYFKQLFDLKPDIITLMLGTNDAKAGNWSKCKDEFEADATAMVDTLLSIASKPRLLLALPPHIFGSPYSMSNDVIIVQVAILRSIAKKKGIEIIDAYTPTDNKNYFKDGCHPNNEGYKVLADVFYNAITSKTPVVAQQYDLFQGNTTVFKTVNKSSVNLSGQAGVRSSISIISGTGIQSDKANERVLQLDGKLLAK